MGSPSVTDTEAGLLRYKHWIIGHVIMLTNIGSSDVSPGTAYIYVLIRVVSR
jgi:hypothetical protein